MRNINTLIGRILLAHIFILAGLNKLGTHYARNQEYMESVGVPGELLPLVILLELGGGLALVIGFKTRLAAWALALFCVATALLFHNNFSDQVQAIMLMKNFAIAGGLLILAEHGAGFYSLDRLFGR